MGHHQPPLPSLISQQVTLALNEDVGNGDLTAALIPPNATATATIISREPMILCGLLWVNEVFKQLRQSVAITWLAKDGDAVTANQIFCKLHGNARTILTGERVALNFLQTLSATATHTHQYVTVVAGTGVRILDTRKTLPGLRSAQKYAVRCGGGYNHRNGLFDAILIKENHIHAAGSIAQALSFATQQTPHDVDIEIEVETIEQFQQALDSNATHILLDNFTLPQIQQAVAINQNRARLEVSGNVNLHNVRAIAEIGIHDISIGALTKHITAIDLSMRFTSNI